MFTARRFLRAVPFVQTVSQFPFVEQIVGAVIGRPLTNCVPFVWVLKENNVLSPYGDVILLFKITRAIDDRPYNL